MVVVKKYDIAYKENKNINRNYGEDRDIFQEYHMRIDNDSDMNIFELFKDLCEKRMEKFCFDWNNKYEYEIWNLVDRLYSLRLQDMEIEQDEINYFDTDGSRLNKYIAANLQLKEVFSVIEWLEINAGDFLPIEEKEDYLPNTKRVVLGRKDLGNMKIVSKLDPDASFKENKPIHAEDQAYQSNLFKSIFEFLRRGRSDEAINLCSTSQGWLAASLAGTRPWLDPKQNDQYEYPSGNKNRVLFKQACLALANQELADPYERAIYGLFAGSINHILPVCKSWEDKLWAHLNCWLERQLQEFLNSQDQFTREEKFTFDSTNLYSGTLEDIFERIKHDESSNQAIDFKSYRKMIQVIILQKLQNMNHNEISKVNRLYLHVALALKKKGECEGLNLDNYVVAYIKELVTSQNLELVCYYCCQLSTPQLQIKHYSDFLSTIEEENKKFKFKLLEKAVKLMPNQWRIIALKTNQTCLEKYCHPVNHQASLRVFEEKQQIELNDQKLLRSIEWILFYPVQYNDALFQINYLSRYFLKLGKLECFLQLFKSLPGDFQNPEWNDSTRLFNDSIPNSSEDLQFQVLNNVNEYFHHKYLVDCVSDYFNYLSIYSQKSSIGTVSMLEWKKLLKISVDKIHSSFKELLTIKWMKLEGAKPTERAADLEYLRNVYLPEIALTCQSSLFSIGKEIPSYFEKCMSLSVILSDPKNGLESVLANSDLLFLIIKQFRMTSVHLLSISKNPFLIK